MPNALYRINGGEVIKISDTQTWPDRNTTYWSVLIDPTFTDGTELRDPSGDLRVLGYAKIHDAGAVRNATQPEIDNFATAQTEDENLQDKEEGQNIFSAHPRFRKVFKAVIKEILVEVNKGTNPKAQMGIITGNTAQTMTSKTWEQITLFNNPDGRASEEFDTLSVDLVNSKIVSTIRGRHFCAFNVSFTGDADTDFLFEIAVNGDKNADIRARRKIGTAAEIGSCGASGFLAFPVDPPGVNEVTLQCRNMEDFDRDLIIAECTIAVFRLENHVTRDLTEMMAAIEAQFDEAD